MFTTTISEYLANLSINSVIVTIMMIFMLIGAIDKIRGNKYGYGEQF
ncbi:MAG: ethanolamine utilization protein EutH, partial [Oscillospiraceae bacterium]